MARTARGKPLPHPSDPGRWRIIRNNKIVIKGDVHRRGGISTFDTGPITVDNNTFYGMTSQDEVAKVFSGTLEIADSGSHFVPA